MGLPVEQKQTTLTPEIPDWTVDAAALVSNLFPLRVQRSTAKQVPFFLRFRAAPPFPLSKSLSHRDQTSSQREATYSGQNMVFFRRSLYRTRHFPLQSRRSRLLWDSLLLSIPIQQFLPPTRIEHTRVQDLPFSCPLLSKRETTNWRF